MYDMYDMYYMTEQGLLGLKRLGLRDSVVHVDCQPESESEKRKETRGTEGRRHNLRSPVAHADDVIKGLCPTYARDMMLGTLISYSSTNENLRWNSSPNKLAQPCTAHNGTCNSQKAKKEECPRQAHARMDVS